MSTPAPEAQPNAAAAAADTPISLDRVMLAMDVVDTLRHQQALVDAELDDDRREAEFVRRVQQIYESQGIEVTEEVVREGVAALKQDRFVYTPPERTFAVRLATIYVERGRWARRAALVLVLLTGIWAAFALPAHWRRSGLVSTFASQVERLAATAESRTRQADELQQQLERAHREGDSAAVARLLAEAASALARCRERATAVAHSLTPRPDAATYPDDRTAWDERLGTLTGQLDGATGDLGAVRGLLAAVQQLRSLTTRLDVSMQRLAGIELSGSERTAIDGLQRDVRAAIDRGDDKAGADTMTALDRRIDGILAARTRQAETRAQFAALATALDGVDVEPAARAELAELRTDIDQAIVAGDWERADQQVARLRALVKELDQVYELRIVSRPGVSSGIWRYEGNDRSRRNHYIVVEAIGRDGKPVSLPITSIEDQSTRTVQRFAVRVPERVFEQVKADKLDNGVVDNGLFGSKRRGARAPEYRFPVLGGFITRWEE